MLLLASWRLHGSYLVVHFPALAMFSFNVNAHLDYMICGFILFLFEIQSYKSRRREREKEKEGGGEKERD